MGPSFSGSYRDVINNLDLALVIYRAVDDGNDFMFVEVNAGVEEIEQVKRQDLIGKRVTEVFPGVEEFGLLDVLRSVYKTGVPERFPTSMYTDDRISGWRDNYVYKIDTGEVVAVYRDLTEQEHLKNELRSSEATYQTVYENTGTTIILVEADMMISRVNNQFEILSGYSRGEVEGLMKWTDFVTPEFLERMKGYHLDRRAGGQVPSEYVCDLVNKSGQIRHILINVSLIPGSNQSAVSLIDITERVKLKARLFAFIESATDGFIMLDEDMCFVEVNESELQQSGLEREDVIGKHILEVWPELEETGRYDAYLKVLETGAPIAFRAVEAASVREELFDISAFKAGEVLGIVTKNVTSQVRYQARLELLNEHASQLVTQNTVQEVVAVTFQIVEDVFGYNYGSFGIVEGDNLHHIIVPQVEKINDFYQPIKGTGVCPRAVRSGVTQVVNETRDDPDFSLAVAEGVYEPRSELVVPILVEDKIGAVLNVESLSPNAFSVDDIRLVELLANHVGSAMSRFSYFDQLVTTVEDLEASKESWEELIASIPDPVLINDGSIWLYANQQAAELWGYESPSDIIGQSIVFFYSEEEGTRLLQRAMLRLEGEDVPSRYEQLIQRVDGNYVPVEINVQVISFNGEPAILSISRDLTERKRSAERLSALHSFTLELDMAESVEDIVETTFRIMREGLGLQYTSFQLLEDEVLITMGVDGSSGVWLALPLSGKGITTRAAREARTVLLGDVRGDPDFVKGSTDSLSELAVPILVENRVLGVLNVESPVLDFFTLDDAKLMEVLAQNVGSALFRLRAAEDKLELERQVLVQQVQVEQEQELSEMKTRFMSTATHELRTPLTVMKGYLNIVMDMELPALAREYLEIAIRNTNRLESLTNDLLEQQRLEEGRVTLQREHIDMNQLVSQIVGEITGLLEERGQRVKVDILDVPAVVFGDRMRISQVLLNLLSNASKYSPEDTMVTVKVEVQGDLVEVSVIDEGIGLSAEDIGKLFTPFPDIIRPTVTERSVGLGLSISRSIVELHGGEIYASSQGHGMGATFRFTLPVEDK